MAKKRATRRPSGVNDNINDFLERREARKYGPRVVSNEAQYSQGEMSKALRAKMAADRAIRSQSSTTPQPSRGPVRDLMGNPLRPSSKPMQGSAQMRNQNPPVIYPKAPDKLSGRTAEFGTRSLLEGMKSWMRGGGGFRTGSK